MTSKLIIRSIKWRSNWLGRNVLVDFKGAYITINCSYRYKLGIDVKVAVCILICNNVVYLLHPLQNRIQIRKCLSNKKIPFVFVHLCLWHKNLRCSALVCVFFSSALHNVFRTFCCGCLKRGCDTDQHFLFLRFVFRWALCLNL